MWMSVSVCERVCVVVVVVVVVVGGLTSSAPHHQEDEPASSLGPVSMGTKQCAAVVGGRGGLVWHRTIEKMSAPHHLDI